MKKILMSVLAIGVVGAAVAYGTGAFFSDTETSTGNTFQTGAIDVKIDSEQHYNGNECVGGLWEGTAAYPVPRTACEGTWPSGSLNGKKFFNFSDLKPGDYGENTISIDVDSNDAWMCANLTVTENSNLGKYLNIVWWADDGDNILESEEKVLYGGPRTLNEWLAVGGGTNVLRLTLADSVMNYKTWPAPTPNTTPIPADQTQYVGAGWCFGAMTLTPGVGSGFSCDGSGDHNDAQLTKVVADLDFSGIQMRHNMNFVCPERANP